MPWAKSDLMNSLIGLRPEDEELSLKRRELHELENQLVDRELQLASLKGELAAFEQLYLNIVGVKYAELDELEAEIAELRAQRQPSNVTARNVARESRSRAQESQESTSRLATSIPVRFSPSPSLKSLYREVARKIHPDLATDETDRANRQRLMAEANKAYEEGNEARLRAILQEYETRPELVPGEGTAAELIRVIRKIAQVRRRITEIEDETSKVTHSDLFALKIKVDENKKQGRDVLDEMASAVNVHISEARAILRNLSQEQDK